MRWVERWVSGSVQVREKMFCDWVPRGLEKKVSLRSRTEKGRSRGDSGKKSIGLATTGQRGPLQKWVT